MEEYRLSGNKDRCVWCGESGKNQYIEIEFKEGTKNAPVRNVLVCSSQCAHELQVAEKKYEGKAPIFLISFFLLLILTGLSLVLMQHNLNWLYLALTGMLVFGITVYLLPFVTPTTVKMVGYKKGYRIGRISGVVIMILSVAFAFLLFFV